MDPITVVKPTFRGIVMAILMICVAPMTWFIGAAIFSTGSYFAGALIIAAGVAELIYGIHFFWKFRNGALGGVRARAAHDVQQAPTTQSAGTTYTSHDLAWVPASRHSNNGSFQDGWLVARPGWIAFLPTASSKNLVLGMASVIVGHHSVTTQNTMFDFAGLAQQGPAVFDETISRLALSNGIFLRAASEALAKSRFMTAFQVDESTWITSRKQLPESLLMGWSVSRKPQAMWPLARLFLLLSLVPSGLAIAGGFIGRRELGTFWNSGFFLWASLVAMLWAGYGFVWMRNAFNAPRAQNGL